MNKCLLFAKYSLILIKTVLQNRSAFPHFILVLWLEFQLVKV